MSNNNEPTIPLKAVVDLHNEWNNYLNGSRESFQRAKEAAGERFDESDPDVQFALGKLAMLKSNVNDLHGVVVAAASDAAGEIEELLS